MGTRTTGTGGDWPRPLPELEDIVAVAILRMLRGWRYLPSEQRCALAGDAVRLAKYYESVGREPPLWLRELMRGLVEREEEAKHAARGSSAGPSDIQTRAKPGGLA